MAAGLINRSDVALHLREEIGSISYMGEYYELNSTKGNSYTCEVTVVATPMDELNIHFTPQISIPKRELQHTHATFVRGLLNPVSILTIANIFYHTFFFHVVHDLCTYSMILDVLLWKGIFWPKCCIRYPRTGRHGRGF